MSRPRLAEIFYAASLVTLPWAGLGVAAFLTGRDLGGGLQLSWVLLGAAVLLRAPDAPGRLAVVWRETPRAWRWAVAGIALSVAVSAAGLVVAPSGEPEGDTWLRYAKQCVQLVIMAPFALWPALWTRGEVRWRRTARWIVAGAVLQAAYGLLQEWHYYAPGPLLPWLERAFTSNPAIFAGSDELYVGGRFLPVPRLRGTICEPLYLGNYLLLALPLVGLTGWGPLRRRLTAAGLLLLLLLTWSRGAWLGGLGALCLAAVLTLLSGRRPARAAIARVVAGAAALAGTAALVLVLTRGVDALTLPWQRLTQTFDGSDWSNLTRLYSLQAGWRAFLLSPVCGVGWGQFGWHFPALVDPTGLQAMVTWPVVANYPLKVLCETGLLGFAVLAGVAAGHLRTALRAVRAPGGMTARHRAALLALAGIALQLLTFSQYNLPHIWVAWGLLLAAGRGARVETAP